MSELVLEMAKDLISAQIIVGGTSPENMSQLLTETYEHLLLLKSRENPSTQSNVYQTGPRITDWKQSIAKHAITCLECGASSRQLDIRHLRQHNLDSQSYRQKYGIPSTQSLASKETTARRRAAVQQSRPWEKTPKYIESQASTVESKEKAVKTVKVLDKKKASTKKASTKKAKAK